ncbi:hypothetical protein ANN_05817 [Periplaneta americana]|uniref:Uncharacterized protein n=1 Tax=Periplaneta americana TaxID=6978 RepID=A0ABQ8TBV6_PERAM|nr:hypothetical protein ANN_05817 [Periplaneta americana]
MATYNLTPTPASTKFLTNDDRKPQKLTLHFPHPCDEQRGMESSQLRATSPLHKEQSMVFTTASVLEKVFTR